MTQKSWGYRPALDGIRAVAVYLVVLFHARMSSAEGGFIGVDLFFVLSGYLVTNVILSEVESTGSVRLRRFYARRVRRLLPAAAVVIVSIAFMWLLIAPLTERLGLIDDARAALLYVANWHFLGQSQDYFAAEAAESPYVHFWSLAIEEQFYFVYPLAIVGLFRLRNRFSEHRRALVVPVGLGLAFAASLVLQLVWAQVNATHAYYGTDARLYQLLAGCLLAVIGQRLTRPWHGMGDLLSGVALLALVVVGSSLVDVSPSTRGIMAMVLSVALIAGLERSPNGLVGRIVSRPLPVYLGRISYGTYLWHWPIVLALGRIFDVAPWTLAIMTIVLATGMAALSAQVLEMPIRQAKRLDRRPIAVVAVGLSFSLLIAALIPQVFESERKPALAVGGVEATGDGASSRGPGMTEKELDKALRTATEAGVPPERDGSTDFQTLDEIVATAKGPVPAGIDWGALANDSYSAPLCAPESPQNCTLATGDGPSVLLVGDSTARTFIPMLLELAEEHDLTVTAQVRQACGWFIGSYRTDQNDNDVCKGARDEWYSTAIPLLQPDVVILAQRSMTGDVWAKQLRADDPAVDDLPLAERLVALGESTLAELESLGVPIIVVEPVAAPVVWSTLDCLSAADLIRECAFEMPADPERVEVAFRDAAAASDLVSAVDLDRIVCPVLPACTPYVDETVVWRDGVHVTTGYWTLHRDEVWQSWTATGAIPAD